MAAPQVIRESVRRRYNIVGDPVLCSVGIDVPLGPQPNPVRLAMEAQINRRLLRDYVTSTFDPHSDPG